MRYLFLLLLILVGIYLLRKALGAGSRGGDRPPEGKVANMVRCRHCGTYLPQDEAVSSEGRWYCSAEHRDADRG